MVYRTVFGFPEDILCVIYIFIKYNKLLLAHINFMHLKKIMDTTTFSLVHHIKFAILQNG